LVISQVVTEIGSGLNGNRRKLHHVLADPAVTTIVVEHRDRLARFGVDHLTSALRAYGRDIVVLDETERVRRVLGTTPSLVAAAVVPVGVMVDCREARTRPGSGCRALLRVVGTGSSGEHSGRPVRFGSGRGGLVAVPQPTESASIVQIG
jgi:hypothetical protein